MRKKSLMIAVLLAALGSLCVMAVGEKEADDAPTRANSRTLIPAAPVDDFAGIAVDAAGFHKMNRVNPQPDRLLG